MKPIKAITLYQPWAQLVICRIKQYETRSWMTGYRGPLAIHAGKAWTRDLQAQYRTLQARHPAIAEMAVDYPLVFGAVLGICRLVSTAKTEAVRDDLTVLERAVGNYGNLRFAWELEVIEVFENPIPAKGEQGLWEWKR